MSTFDLFSESPPRAGRFFASVRSHERFADTRRFLNRLFNDAVSRQLLDRNFPVEFPVDCPQRCWELLLIHHLDALGYRLSRVGDAGPDLLCEGNGVRFYVEAVAPKPSEDGPPHQPGPVKDGGARTSYSIERISNSIDAKLKKWEGWRAKGQVDERLPYVVALSQIEIADFIAEFGARVVIRHVLFGEGYRVVDLNIDSGMSRELGPEHQPQVLKSNGAPLQMGLFLAGNPSTAPLSALLYYQLYDLANAPTQGRAGLRLYLNGNALRPLGLNEDEFGLKESPHHSDGGSDGQI